MNSEPGIPRLPIGQTQKVAQYRTSCHLPLQRPVVPSQRRRRPRCLWFLAPTPGSVRLEHQGNSTSCAVNVCAKGQAAHTIVVNATCTKLEGIDSASGLQDVTEASVAASVAAYPYTMAQSLRKNQTMLALSL